MIREPARNTAYVDDFAWTGPNDPNDMKISKGLLARPNSPTQKRVATQSVSTQLLTQGTTKATVQIPGYTGHIPTNRRIPVKEKHCNGETIRPKDLNLTLTYPMLGGLPGYTGAVLV
jgi:hypothetical protein